jgi:hypothetical protein
MDETVNFSEYAKTKQFPDNMQKQLEINGKTTKPPSFLSLVLKNR